MEGAGTPPGSERTLPRPALWNHFWGRTQAWGLSPTGTMNGGVTGTSAHVPVLTAHGHLATPREQRPQAQGGGGGRGLRGAPLCARCRQGLQIRIRGA